ncbi:MAG: IPT/TIG domain-containing protein [Sphingobacteriales bacterium]|nr:IPT/TIG domain-containing protein [Sphingobacteriales bacterium]OJY90377.1 MAG: cell shape determination protein CcmA [Sphingobacteriales bacterium 44-15]
MKKIFSFKNLAWLVVTFLAMLVINACSKEDFKDGSPHVEPGDPVFASISTDSASGGSVVTLKGTGLGDMRTIMFDKGDVPASFYSTLNTETALIFSVPDTALGGQQNIVFTNSIGKTLTVPFRVLAYPSVASVSNYDFTEGSQITLTGNNLEDVSKVTFTGSTDEITIISQTKKELVIELTATEVGRASLNITNATGTITTSQELVNIDKAYQIFTDSYGDGWGDGSWGDPGFISTTEHKTGSKSVGKTYAKGNWHLIGFANWWPGLASDPSYKYLTVWIKGGSADMTLYLTGDKRNGGFGNNDQSMPLNIPAKTWTYFKLSLADIGLWAKGSPSNQIGFWIKGPDNQDETFYFDDLLLVK